MILVEPLFYLKTHRHFFYSECTLSVQIGREYFSYSIFDKEKNDLIGLAWYKISCTDFNGLNNIIENTEALNEAFDRINIAFDFNTYTLLNSELSIEKKTALSCI